MVAKDKVDRAWVRWDAELGEWKLKCASCEKRHQTVYYWPLTTDFWNYRLGMTRCIACQREFRAMQKRKRRENPILREIDLQRTREIRSVKGFVYNERLREKNARLKSLKETA